MRCIFQEKLAREFERLQKEALEELARELQGDFSREREQTTQDHKVCWYFLLHNSWHLFVVIGNNIFSFWRALLTSTYVAYDLY